MARVSLEGLFRDLFLGSIGVTELDVEWMLSCGDDEALRQQESNVKTFLDIAYGVNLKRHPEAAETVDAMRRNGMQYRHDLRRFRLSRIAKNNRAKYLGTLSRYHDAMVGDCRKLCVLLYPQGLPFFDVCFGAN